MPYCSKCGTKLEEDEKYCHACGAPAGAPSVRASATVQRPMRKGWSPVYTLAIVLGTILIVGLIASVLLLLPFRQVNFSEFEQVPLQPGRRMINVNLTADIAAFNVTFGDLGGKALTMNISVKGGVGVLAPSDPLNITFGFSSAADTILVNARIVRNGAWWPLFGGLNVACDVKIDRSINVTLNTRTSLGSVFLAASQGVILDSLDLEATTGKVDASLGKGVTINGGIAVRSTTGSSSLVWVDVKVTHNVSVEVSTITGGTAVDITQNNAMDGNVTLTAETVTGGVDFSVFISNSIGASINASTSVGGVNTNLTHFSKIQSTFESENYPAPSDFLATLKTTTGGISVAAQYEPGQHV